jgi:hypothetical protein
MLSDGYEHGVFGNSFARLICYTISFIRLHFVPLSYMIQERISI